MDGSKAAAGESESVLGLLLKKAPVAGIGVLAAFVTVLAIDHWRAGTPVATTARKDEGRDGRVSQGGERVVRSVVIDQQAFDRIAELERQVREMQNARTASAADAAGPDDALSDPAEARRKVDEMYAQLDRAHERDAPDPQWSPAATKRLVTGLTALGEKLGFTVGATDCKTTTCRATVAWGNYSSARTTGAQLAEEVFPGLNCTQRIRLDEPRDPNVPYSTQLYLDCADLRAGLVDEIVEVRTD